PIRDPARDRCDDLRELDVELRGAHGSARRRELGLRGADGRLERLDLLLADRTDVDETAGSLELGARVLDARARRRGASPCLVSPRLERPRIDREEQLAPLDPLSLFEMRFDQITRHARAHLDVLHRLEAADELVPIDDRADERLGCGNLRHHDGLRRRSLAAAAQHAGRGERRKETEKAHGWSSLLPERETRPAASPRVACQQMVTY